MISQGFWLDFNSYLTDSWCQLDFIIVVFSVIDISLPDSKLSFIKIIRLLRILRPLKFISSNPNMKLMVNCLLKSIGGIFNVSLVIIIIWYYSLTTGWFSEFFSTTCFRTNSTSATVFPNTSPPRIKLTTTCHNRPVCHWARRATITPNGSPMISIMIIWSVVW